MSLPEGFEYDMDPVLTPRQQLMIARWGVHNNREGLTVRQVCYIFGVPPWLVRPRERGDWFWWHVTRRVMRVWRWLKRRLR